MNEHQLLCFLTVSRTLNFSAAARELYCAQPALRYQIRSLEKELDAALFLRTTTQVALTEAGRALLPHAEDICRGILNARTALKGFGTHHTLTLRLPPVLLQRDPIYPILMARLHAALPGYEFKVDTTPVPSSYHHMLCTEAAAALSLPFGPLPPEIRCSLTAARVPPFPVQFCVVFSRRTADILRAPLSGHGGFRPEAAGDALFHTGLADGGKLRIGLRRAAGRAGDVPLPDDIPGFPCRVAHPAASVHPGHPPADPAG